MIRILVADDEHLIRDAIAGLLDLEDGFEVVGRAASGDEALAAGVRGFLPKTVSSRTFAQVVRNVAAGGRYVDPELAAEAISAGDSPLSPREADILALARDGAPVDEIARRVSLSRRTVRNHLASAIAKLDAANRHEAARIAAGHGWI
ncbi:response regulator transcription factor [Nonomuraea angiospora]|uniref:response regulator transcription factor n=1 Tax=Nonomuraea angiospora TaxID=46172 RepID=UPI00340071A0